MKFLQKIADKIRKYSSQRGYVCDGCGVEIFTYPSQRLCETCERNMHKNSGLRCGKCGRQTLAEGVCLACKSKLPAFTQGISPFVYRGETAAFVNRIKNGKRRLAYFFAEKMTEELLKSPMIARVKEQGEGVLIIPVPMTVNAEKERGYNQAAELAEIIAESLQKADVCALYDNEVLQKKKETAQQKHLSYSERMQNISGAYHVHKRAVCKGKTVVLVDDIMTTGATGSECAERLLHAGAKEVIFLVAAALREQK